MQPLYNYILEQAIGNIGITFEEFKRFVLDNDNKPISKKFREKFGKTGPAKMLTMMNYAWTMVEQMETMGVEIDDNILRFIYEKLSNIPESVVNKLLGHGANAGAFDLGDKVIKVFYNGRVRSDNLKFYEYCMKNECEFFPKVYRIGKGYVIMEKLEMNTPKIKKMFGILNTQMANFGKTFYWAYKEGDLEDIKLNKTEQEIVDWLDEVKTRLWDNRLVPVEGDLGDLHEGNVGQRKDGTIVYFDI